MPTTHVQRAQTCAEVHISCRALLGPCTLARDSAHDAQREAVSSRDGRRVSPRYRELSFRMVTEQHGSIRWGRRSGP